MNRTTRSASRLTTVGRRHFLGAVVIVEADALVGLSTTQLADYGAMRAFASTDPAKVPEPAPPTILTILEAPMGSPVPLTMSEWDLAFLKSLYASPVNLYAGAQRSAIRREMGKELQPAAEDPQ